MSGHLQFSTESTEIRKTTNVGYLILRGGTTYNDSANVLVYGNDNSTNAGKIILRAGNGSTSITVDKDGTSAPTPSTSDNSTKIATTSFCKSYVTKTVTLNSTYVSNGSVIARINNKIAVVEIRSLVISQEIASGQFVLASGLPKMQNQCYYALFKYNDTKNFRCTVNSNGELTTLYGTIPAGEYYGGFCYITSE